MTDWNVGCSLKQDSGYEQYLERKSLAPFAYTMSCVAPAACPLNGPQFSECRQYAPGGSQAAQETSLWRQSVTRGMRDTSLRPQTAMAGTSAYRGPQDGAHTSMAVDRESTLRLSEPVGGFCRRTVMENLHTRDDFLNGFVPQVESFPVGGVPSRCNKLAYKQNPTNSFVASYPIPMPLTVTTGTFPPNT